MGSIALGVSFTGCKEKPGTPEEPTSDERIEALAMNETWKNYLVAASSELYNDCVKLWAAWAGPDALSAEETAIVGEGFFGTASDYSLANGYAYQVKNPGESNINYKSATAAIEATIIQGSVDIAGEVGPQKIGTPNSYAKAGDLQQAVLEVESWYSWNSIKDYSDNIISIRSSYFGGRGNTSANGKSLSDFVKKFDAALDTEITNAINNAYTSIVSMDAPFRNNLVGSKVDAAITACADLEEVYSKKLLPLLEKEGGNYDFLPVLQAYADDVVVATYKDMKDKAKALKESIETFYADPTNQSKLDAACEAWRATRIPWEESEAFLIGPADKLGLDPSLDSWPLDQQDILTILQDDKLTTVDQLKSAIQSESVRGFHTIELLLFKDGKNRTAK